MKILLINHYAGSKDYGMEYRPYYLAREWVKQGHQVSIVGATYSHLRLKNPVVNEDYTCEDVDGIRYIWFKTPAYVGSLARIKNMLVFMRKLYKYSSRLVQDVKPDLVIASSTYPLDNYPAHKIAKMAGAKYTYEIHDLWPLSPMLIGGYSKNHPFIWVMQKAEDYAYKYVDKVVSLLWNAEDHCKEHGLGSGKFVCVPNGYFPEEWTDDKINLPLPDEHQNAFDSLKGKTIVGFAGGFAASGNVITLVKSAVELKYRNDIHFVLVGKGPELPSYEKVIKDNNLSNITILPSVPKKLIPAVNKHFDIAHLGGLHSVLHKYGTSYNKMTDYMLSGKPIVQSVDEPGSVVERVGCGIRVEAENAKAVADAIVKLADMTEDERTAMGKKGKEYVEKNLPWSKLAEDFLKPFLS
jgi:glycosyltransferase involved in cell wall biosynthesis